MPSRASGRSTAGTRGSAPRRRAVPARGGIFALVAIAFLAGSCNFAALSAPGTAEPLPETAPVSPTPTKKPREATALAAFLAEQPTGLTDAERQRLARTILAESRRLELPAPLVLGVIRVESGFRNFSVSNVGALGLMQVLPSTGAEVAESIGVTWTGPQTLFDPEANVKIGLTYLRRLVDRYGDVAVALAAYNWGPGHVDGRLRRGVPLPRVYPSRVLESRRAHETQVASRS